jgi:hypothetical protein
MQRELSQLEGHIASTRTHLDALRSETSRMPAAPAVSDSELSKIQSRRRDFEIRSNLAREALADARRSVEATVAASAARVEAAKQQLAVEHIRVDNRERKLLEKLSVVEEAALKATHEEMSLTQQVSSVDELKAEVAGLRRSWHRIAAEVERGSAHPQLSLKRELVLRTEASDAELGSLRSALEASKQDVATLETVLRAVKAQHSVITDQARAIESTSAALPPAAQPLFTALPAALLDVARSYASSGDPQMVRLAVVLLELSAPLDVSSVPPADTPEACINPEAHRLLTALQAKSVASALATAALDSPVQVVAPGLAAAKAAADKVSPSALVFAKARAALQAPEPAVTRSSSWMAMILNDSKPKEDASPEDLFQSRLEAIKGGSASDGTASITASPITDGSTRQRRRVAPGTSARRGTFFGAFSGNKQQLVEPEPEPSPTTTAETQSPAKALKARIAQDSVGGGGAATTWNRSRRSLAIPGGPSSSPTRTSRLPKSNSKAVPLSATTATGAKFRRMSSSRVAAYVSADSRSRALMAAVATGTLTKDEANALRTGREATGSEATSSAPRGRKGGNSWARGSFFGAFPAKKPAEDSAGKPDKTHKKPAPKRAPSAPPRVSKDKGPLRAIEEEEEEEEDEERQHSSPPRPPRRAGSAQPHRSSPTPPPPPRARKVGATSQARGSYFGLYKQPAISSSLGPDPLDGDQSPSSAGSTPRRKQPVLRDRFGEVVPPSDPNAARLKGWVTSTNTHAKASSLGQPPQRRGDTLDSSDGSIFGASRERSVSVGSRKSRESSDTEKDPAWSHSSFGAPPKVRRRSRMYDAVGSRVDTGKPHSPSAERAPEASRAASSPRGAKRGQASSWRRGTMFGMYSPMQAQSRQARLREMKKASSHSPSIEVNALGDSAAELIMTLDIQDAPPATDVPATGHHAHSTLVDSLRQPSAAPAASGPPPRVAGEDTQASSSKEEFKSSATVAESWSASLRGSPGRSAQPPRARKAPPPPPPRPTHNR